MKNTDIDLKKFLKDIQSPSTATFLEVLCCEPKFNKRFQHRVVEELTNILITNMIDRATDEGYITDECDDGEVDNG